MGIKKIRKRKIADGYIQNVNLIRLFQELKADEELVIKIVDFNNKEKEIIFFWEYNVRSERFTVYEKSGIFGFTSLAGFENIKEIGTLLSKRIKAQLWEGDVSI
jgi:hypothetical protein